MPDSSWYRARLEAAAVAEYSLLHRDLPSCASERSEPFRDAEIEPMMVRSLVLDNVDLDIKGGGIIVLEKLNVPGSDCYGDIFVPEEIFPESDPHRTPSHDTHVRVIALSYAKLYEKAVELGIISE